LKATFFWTYHSVPSDIFPENTRSAGNAAVDEMEGERKMIAIHEEIESFSLFLV
jgi:hypothetical protein